MNGFPAGRGLVYKSGFARARSPDRRSIALLERVMPNDQPSLPAAAGEEYAAPVSDGDRVRIVIGVLLAMLLAALDQTIVAPAIPTIGAELGDAQFLSWIVSAYFLTATAVTPLYGKLSDIHGRRPILLTAIGIFVLGSIVCALAPDLMTLVIGRAVQGIGGGGLMALAQTVIGDLVPPKERGRFSVYISATWATASIAGPILGGFISEHLHWTLVFWLNLPLAAIAVAMTNSSLKRLPWHRREHKLDLLGSALIVAAAVSLMLALTLGGSASGWASPAVLSLFGAALLLAVLFAAHLRRASEPLIPLNVLGNPVVAAATLSVFFAMMCYIGLSVFIPLYLELVLGFTASMAGLALVGYMVGTVVGASRGARSMAKLEHYSRPASTGLALSIAGLLVLALANQALPVVATIMLLIVIGFGSGALFPITVISVQNAVPPQDLGTATGVLGFLRSLGSAIGVAVLGAVATAYGIAGHLELAPGGGSGNVMSADGAQFMPVFLAAAACQTLSLGCLLMMRELPLRGRGD